MARILAVDDERAILDALARVLGRDGHEVVKAADPTAVPGMDLSRFDLVLCDVMMPGPPTAWAPTTTSASPSGPRNCAPRSRPIYAVSAGRARTPSPSGRCGSTSGRAASP